MKKILNYLMVPIISLLSFSAYADNNQYTIYVDAGSSGLRLHIFQYDTTQSVPTLNDVFSEKITPGLSSYADHPELAGSAIKKLLDDATQYLQSNAADAKTTQINILATAGMRLLTTEQQDAIYQNVTTYIHDNYTFPIGDIKTISGQYEALYGWLDINYLSGNFQIQQATIGSIDMGGASTQIAFATEDRSKPKDLLNVDINHQHYTVFSKSFLGLGQDQARDIMTADQAANRCFPDMYAFNKTNAGAVGKYNLKVCADVYAGIIQKQEVTHQIVALQKTQFIAYSGIYTTYNFLAADKTPDQFTLEAQIQTICTKPWTQLQTDYPTVPEKYLANYCANAAYQDQLLYKTYNLTGAQLTVTSQIQQKEIDWTLGAALYKLTMPISPNHGS